MKGDTTMDTTSLLQAVSTVGFPIVMCGCLMYYIYTTQTKTQEIITELTKAITELKAGIENANEE